MRVSVLVCVLSLLTACGGGTSSSGNTMGGPQIVHIPQLTKDSGVSDGGAGGSDVGATGSMPMTETGGVGGSISPNGAPTTIGEAGSPAVTGDGGSSAPTAITGDTRIAVAYCAAQVLGESMPMSCETTLPVAPDTHLRTMCDNGVEIQWNCEKCGDVLLGDTLIGHVGMQDAYFFQINPIAEHSAISFCTLNSAGDAFTVTKNH